MTSPRPFANSQGFLKSSLALRNLRGVVIILILAFHSFSAYIVSQPASPGRFDEPPFTWRAFPIVDSERWTGFDLLCAFLFLFLMQLMFFYPAFLSGRACHAGAGERFWFAGFSVSVCHSWWAHIC